MSTAVIEQSALRLAKMSGIRAFLAGADYLYERDLGNGETLRLCQMMLGNVRLTVSVTGDTTGYHDGYCYHDADAAWRAVLGWDGEGDPEGWVRHIESGAPASRRNP